MRDYACGCVPELDHFCKDADQRVWEEREAAMERSLDGINQLQDIALSLEEVGARRWLIRHYGENLSALRGELCPWAWETGQRMAKAYFAAEAITEEVARLDSELSRHAKGEGEKGGKP